MGDIRLDAATKVYANGVRAVDAVELTVADGEFMVLVGPSGCGKSTLLRMIAGLEHVTEGRILIGGTDVTSVQPRLRDIAMVFQDYALYPQMTVRENLGFALKLRRVPRLQREARVLEVAKILGLDETLLDRKPGLLSGGQRQRVAMGRAVVRQPAAFLMDEPLSNLDAKLRAQTRGEIRRLQREVNTTTVYVTHDQVEAMTMGDRIAVMSNGRIEQVGPPDAVYSNPANTFVAAFIGSPAMALVEMTRGEGGVFARGVVQVPLGERAASLPGEIVVGVRPEFCRLWADDANLYGPYEGTVDYVESLGRETFIGVTAADDAGFVIEAEGGIRATIGETVSFGFARTGIHLFDGATRAAITTL
ncbi:MAG: sn-glycerol-3-phosphate ABC transporter ATP-binding protein UgpC [Thermoleophilia bacterium]